jgi:hypothetical protein
MDERMHFSKTGNSSSCSIFPLLQSISRYGIPISAHGFAVRGSIWRQKQSRFAVDGVRIKVRLDVYGFSFERWC